MANYLLISASSSLGRATQSFLEEKGDSCFTTARSHEKIIPDYELDATDFEAVAKAFQAAQDQLGSLDGVVNFAGSLLLKPAHLTSFEEYQETIAASLTTAFATVRSAPKHLSGGGSVVLISSGAALLGLKNHEAIAAAKAGIVGLARSAAATYAAKKIRFNVVAPGLVESDLTQRITSNDSSLKYSLGLHPLGRIGQPNDIAQAIAFLLDPQNDWISGDVLRVDGGLSSMKF